MKKSAILLMIFFVGALHVYGQGVTGISAGKKIVTDKRYFLYNIATPKVIVPASSVNKGHIYRIPANEENISQTDKRFAPMKEPPLMPVNAKRALL